MDPKENSQEPTQQDETADGEVEARRRFLKTVGAGAVAAPAVAMLLSRSAKAGGGGCGS
jgi:hypothetical protein